MILADTDPELERLLNASGRFAVRNAAFTPFDAGAAEKIRHFDTYNRTAAGQRVADIVATARAHPDAILVAQGDAALAALLAAAVAPVALAVLDVGGFDTASDEDFVRRLYIPGLRRAGDLQTAASLAGHRLVLHNAGDRFVVRGVKAGRSKLTARQIVALVRERMR